MKQKAAWKTGAAAAALAVLLTGCTAGSPDTSHTDRETIKKPDKTITVINNPVAEPSKVAVGNIATVDNARGMNFLDDNQIIYSKPNTEISPQTVEGEQVYPNNLYLYNLTDKNGQLLVEDGQNLGFTALSPDGKHLFYKMTEEATGFGRLYDMETKQSVKLDTEDPIDLNDGQWLDNSHVLVSTLFGKILVADLTGKTTTIVEPGGILLGTAAGDGGIYYIKGGTKRELYFLADTAGAQPVKIAEGVEWVIPSPDRKQLAIVKESGDSGVRTLTVVDPQGRSLLQIAQGAQIFGTSWSPDGTKLAFNLTSEGSGDNGIIVADALTGENTQVLVEQAADTLAWSPSGKKLLTSTYQNDHFVTSVITFQ
ncbi:WD40 repeat domain-containing protein [Paenibacillus protaetiae]|uniref:Lipoprotein LpqB beta-propeller domain-containing protein n=1 Tax=Paenibacillus protaetiae TaxID=2509456 RepID=A0A4P6F9S0_9BACL|nr:PD40 domain-containing protein [Paenibacillus protaetiae]QAY67238.1 hypothetical protein ET464_13340 [Paenibacillus protaetiae]